MVLYLRAGITAVPLPVSNYTAAASGTGDPDCRFPLPKNRNQLHVSLTAKKILSSMKNHSSKIIPEFPFRPVVNERFASIEKTKHDRLTGAARFSAVLRLLFRPQRTIRGRSVQQNSYHETFSPFPTAPGNDFCRVCHRVIDKLNPAILYWSSRGWHYKAHSMTRWKEV